MPMPEAVLDFRVPPQAQVSRVVRESVSSFARAHGVGDEDLAHFLNALGEALANAIEHSHASKPVEIGVRVNADRIIAMIQDNGVGFRTDLVEPTLPDPTSERGRGLPIMRRCSDIFAIDSIPGKGTAVVVGRYLRTAAA